MRLPEGDDAGESGVSSNDLFKLAHIKRKTARLDDIFHAADEAG